ncbi:DNA-binding CsgD family transcriptional regulator [Pedobacter sp. CG_S7]|uniref:response regulator transcription factor n=1 Tax=Pedobacter sp. CG_S7 TaxID=3143930 RepID=UPI003394DD55
MKVLNSDMELVTLVFLISETILLLYQVLFYLQNPMDKKQSYYLLLLFLFVIYNLLGGLFPDPNQNLSIVLQNILAYGSGFAVGCYIPYYFYKTYGLRSIRFHAVWGVGMFLFLPFVLFIVIEYMISGKIIQSVKHGMIIPFIYSFYAMYNIFIAIRKKLKEDGEKNFQIMLFFVSLMPWISLPGIAYFQGSQILEVSVMNTSFVFISLLFFYTNVKEARKNNEILSQLLSRENNLSAGEKFDLKCESFKLTSREKDVVELICQGLKYKDIADQLFISERTVTKHSQNIFLKVGVSSRYELNRVFVTD